MAKNFASLAFTDAVKALQEKYGSRASYARMEQVSCMDGLTKREVGFISQRDSFYMASIGENGFPYIQHRGGPRGFLKILDAKHIAFLDFKGNMQYISAGNVETNKKVSLIMVDYPARARLKIYAKAEIVELKDNPALFDLLDIKEYKFRPERMIVLHIEAYDWNCPQHITPRYTVEEVKEAFSGQQQLITTLQDEVKQLRQKLKDVEI